MCSNKQISRNFLRAKQVGEKRARFQFIVEITHKAFVLILISLKYAERSGWKPDLSSGEKLKIDPRVIIILSIFYILVDKGLEKDANVNNLSPND